MRPNAKHIIDLRGHGNDPDDARILADGSIAVGDGDLLAMKAYTYLQRQADEEAKKRDQRKQG